MFRTEMTPEQARVYAARLIAAADRVEAGFRAGIEDARVHVNTVPTVCGDVPRILVAVPQG